MSRKKKQQVEEVFDVETSCEGMANPFGGRVCEFGRGDRVLVHAGSDEEPNDFTGTVSYAKWSNISGWWLDIKRDDSNMTYHVPVELVEIADEMIEEIIEETDTLEPVV